MCVCVCVCMDAANTRIAAHLYVGLCYAWHRPVQKNMELAIHRAARSINLGVGGGKKKHKKNKHKKKKKKKHGSKRREEEDIDVIGGDDDDAALDLVAMNRIVEDLDNNNARNAQQQQLPDKIWDEWLWWSDPNDPPNSQTLLNRCQLLGLLICRYRAARQPPYSGTLSLPSNRLVIVKKPASQMTLRELRDSISNLVLLWGTDVHSAMGKLSWKVDSNRNRSMLLFLDACFHRLGELAWATWPCGDPTSPISDDIASIERVPEVVVSSSSAGATSGQNGGGADREQV